jgi:hypothetical protein
MVPARIDSNLPNTQVLLSAGITEAQAFRAAFPLAQDSPVTAYVWNPYILVASFEWITAAFAMSILRHWVPSIREWVLGWLVAGAVATVGWFTRHYIFSDSTHGAKLAVAMGIILFFSYTAAGVICSMYIELGSILSPALIPTVYEEGPPSMIPDDTTNPDTLWQKSSHGAKLVALPSKRVMVQGRIW